MIPRIQSLPVLAKSDDASSGWVGRIAQQLDIIKDILSNLAVGNGLEMNVDAMGRVTIDLIGGVGGAMSGLPNSAFVAEATLHENSNDHFDVRMLGGTAQGIFGRVEVIPTTTWINVSDGMIAWLEYDPSAADGSRWSLNNGSVIPSNADGDSLNYFAVIPLFIVEAGRPNNVVQYHYGSVYIATPSNVVQVQRASAP